MRYNEGLYKEGRSERGNRYAFLVGTLQEQLQERRKDILLFLMFMWYNLVLGMQRNATV